MTTTDRPTTADRTDPGTPPARDVTVAVEVRDLVKVYPRPGGGTLKAVDGVSFQVRRGEIFGFLGPNGAGKTTALEIIEGIRRPTSGAVRVLGVDPQRELDRVKEIIGVQLQSASYFSLLTITEILELFGSFYPRRRPTAELLEIVGLTDKRKAYVRHLSGGQQRRFSVAAALVNDPEVIFLDEPTTGLDPQVRHNVWELVRRLNQDEGKTVVLTTHYMEEAELLADRVAVAANYKARGVLKRLAVTPVSAPLVIATQLGTFVLLGIWTGSAMLTIGALIGAQVELTAHLLWIPPLLGVVALTGLSLSFAIAGFTNSPQTASSVSQNFGLPLFFFTGAIFPVAALPGVLPDLVGYAIPFTALIKTVRGIALTGAPITDYGTEILIGLIWLTALFALAVRCYRFTDD